MARQSAIVSFWKSEHSTNPADFVASGFFVADGLILTARHALEPGVSLWARPASGGAASYRVSERKPHGELDVALVAIDVMPSGATAITPLLDLRERLDVDMLGYFEGRREEVIGVQVLNYDSEHRHFVFGVKQPQGHSGGALCVGEKVWGMPVRHYLDANTHRGCAIALHQFWDWLKPFLPPPAASLPLDKPPPTWDKWLARARVGLVNAFSRPVFEKFEAVMPRLANGLPQALDCALSEPDPHRVGERCVDALVDLVEACLASVREGTADIAGHERAAAREGFRCGMRAAARLCLDPTKLLAHGIDPDGNVAPITDVPAYLVVGATLAVRAKPDESWRVGREAGIPVLTDVNAHELPLELGAGEDREKALKEAAFRAVAGPEKLPERFDERLCRTIRGRAASEAKAGRARVLVLQTPLAASERDDLRERIADTLGVHLMCLREPDGPASDLFLYREEDLAARICAFLELLEEPEWKPA